MEEELTPISLRLPKQMVERIKSSARFNRRSLNAEATVLLEQTLGGSRIEKAEVAATTPAE